MINELDASVAPEPDQAADGLGYDGSPVAHMFRSIQCPDPADTPLDRPPGESPCTRPFAWRSSSIFGNEIAIRARTLVHDAANPEEVMRDVVEFATAGRTPEESR